MIDLSPQPHDKSAAPADLHSPPVRDLPERVLAEDARQPFAHERAEAAVQFLSRWAGPAILLLAIGTIGWLLLG